MRNNLSYADHIPVYIVCYSNEWNCNRTVEESEQLFIIILETQSLIDSEVSAKYTSPYISSFIWSPHPPLPQPPPTTLCCYTMLLFHETLWLLSSLVCIPRGNFVISL